MPLSLSLMMMEGLLPEEGEGQRAGRETSTLQLVSLLCSTLDCLQHCARDIRTLFLKFATFFEVETFHEPTGNDDNSDEYLQIACAHAAISGISVPKIFVKKVSQVATYP